MPASTTALLPFAPPAPTAAAAGARPRPAPRAARWAAGLALAAAACAPAGAATAWNEAVQGDLANSGLVPTVLSMGLGSNLVLGTTGRANSVVDRDYFSVSVPAGLQMDTLVVLPGSTFLGLQGYSFIAVQAGSQVTVNPTGGSAAGLLGWAHFGDPQVGDDILGLMGIAGGAIGFSSPLPAGDYAFWIQDTGTGVATYRLDFVLSAVPEPATALLLGLGAAALAAGSRRRAAG